MYAWNVIHSRVATYDKLHKNKKYTQNYWNNYIPNISIISENRSIIPLYNSNVMQKNNVKITLILK